MAKTYKVTVIGDIMCEPALLKQVTTEHGYEFMPVFAPMKKLLSEADYVIGNLETPLAGEAAGYTDSLVCFNTPDDIAKVLKQIGVDMVSTCNNHTLDRGLDGLKQTLKALDEMGLAHTGSYADPDELERIHYFTLGETTIAVIASTYSTNELLLDADGKPDDRYLNRLRPQKGTKSYMPNPPILRNTKKFISELLGRELIWEEGIALKKVLGVPVGYADDALEPEKYEPYLAQIRADMEQARKRADLIFYLPHVGGQFNTEPGYFSNYMTYQGIALGADAVYAAHSHTTQKAVYIHGKPCFYSMGNVTMWPHSTYSVRETLPEYGLAAHAYVSEGKLVKNTFSIFKMVQDDNTPLSVVPTDELYESLASEEEKAQLLAEVGSIYTRVTGREAPAAPAREYEL